MRVHLIKRKTAENYFRNNANSRVALLNWLFLLRQAEWDTPKDILNTFNQADNLGNGTQRVVFNIGGNKYRMICRYHFGKTKVRLYIKWIGTHSEYSKLCQYEGQYFVRQY